MATIDFKYSELCSVSVVQPYYRNTFTRQTLPEPTADTTFIPTEECTKLMKRLELSIKPNTTTGGFFVIARTNGKNPQNEDLLRFKPNSTDVLRFWMVVKNGQALTFDDVPAGRTSEQFLLLTNDRVISPPETELHLTTAASGITNDPTSDDYDWVTTSGSVYRYTHTSNVSQNAVHVKHLLTDIQVAPVSVVNQGGQGFITFDLSSLPLGECELSINGNPVTSFYYAGNNIPSGTIGVVELMLASSIDSEYRIVKSGGALPATRPEFVIRLQNRSTIWRYTLRLEANSLFASDLESLSEEERTLYYDHINITSNDPEVSFLLQSSSDEELIFSSAAPIPLQEQYRVSNSGNDLLQLNLRKNIDPDISSEGTIVKSDLPYPSTSVLAVEHDPDSGIDFMYSDIFLTL